MSIRRKIASIAGASGSSAIGELILPNKPRVIFFHGVTAKPIVDKMPQACQMPLGNFETIIDYLLCKGYNFISPQTLEEATKCNRPLSKRDILLTFDDGYRNNLTTAAPFLAKRKIPFLIFACAGLVDRQERISAYYLSAAIFNPKCHLLSMPSLRKEYLLTDDNRMVVYYEVFNRLISSPENVVRQMVDDFKTAIGIEELCRLKERHETEDIMTWDELNEIQNFGGFIGSHCVDHCVLHANQNNEEIITQLEDSKEMIKSHVGECKYYSFPNGSRLSVCSFAEKKASEIYNLSFGVDGKYIHDIKNRSFISRINACEDLSVFKAQFSLLSML